MIVILTLEMINYKNCKYPNNGYIWIHLRRLKKRTKRSYIYKPLSILANY